MGESRLRIKFGEHEFESDGSAESVERHFELFKRLIMPELDMRQAMVAKQPSQDDESKAAALEKIVQMRGRVVSLSVTASAEDAVLIILLGQKQFCQNDAVSGVDLMRGLRESAIRIPRADIIMTKHAQKGIVIASGHRRRCRYRLSSAGIDCAQQIARQLIASVP